MKKEMPWTKYYKNAVENLVYPETGIAETLRKVVSENPEKTALWYLGKPYTYRKLWNRIENTRNMLVSNGVKKGDRVAVCLPNIPQSVYLLYAADLAGAVACFVNPRAPLAELQTVFSELNPKLVVSIDKYMGTVSQALRKYGDVPLIVTSAFDESNLLQCAVMRATGRTRKDSVSRISADSLRWCKEMKRAEKTECSSAEKKKSEPAVILFSGGTTGEPKGVVLSGFALNAMAVQTAFVSSVSVKDKCMLAVLPVFHGFGLCVCVHTPLIHGASCVLVPVFSPMNIRKCIKKHRPNFIAGVPTLYEALYRAQALDGIDLSCLEGVFSGGDKLPSDLKMKFDGYMKENGAKVTIREGYGLTECVTASCLTPPGYYREGSVGVPFPDTLYKICDVKSAATLPFRCVGEICISSPALMSGYLNHREESLSALRCHSDGRVWLHTGDAGYMDEDGFVYFTSRLKRMIVTCGHNVYPAMVESVLMRHPAVKDSCAIGVQDDYKIQRIKVYVELSMGYAGDKELANELSEHCRRYLAGYSVPEEFVFLCSIPRTSMGKIAYGQLS